jgi:hypothetical protein
VAAATSVRWWRRVRRAAGPHEDPWATGSLRRLGLPPGAATPTRGSRGPALLIHALLTHARTIH